MEFEGKIFDELEIKRAQNLELVKSSLNLWFTHPKLRAIYQGLWLLIRLQSLHIQHIPALVEQE